jgi:hypothetical protein
MKVLVYSSGRVLANLKGVSFTVQFCHTHYRYARLSFTSQNVYIEEEQLTPPYMKEEQDVYRRLPRTLGYWLAIILVVQGIFAVKLVLDTLLLWHGVAAQGVIVDERSTSCTRAITGHIFSVWFYDQAGREHHGTISQCDYLGFNVSPGDRVTLVYLPDNPTMIAPPDELSSTIQSNLDVTILLSLITLILLIFWIRKRIRRVSLQHKHAQAGHSAEQEPYRN